MRATAAMPTKGFGPTSWDIVADPRGKYVYVSNTGNSRTNSVSGVARCIVDKNDPNFRQVTFITQGISATATMWGVALSDAGDRLYASTGNTILEYDTATLKRLRSWSVSQVYYLAHR